jgi:retron-type reverse transcriptase
MIMNHIKEQVKRKLIVEQVGFKPGKSCTGQVINLYQQIEDGYENKKVTGVVLVDLSAAYDTVNHNLLLKKIYKCTNDWYLVQIISSMLRNRRFTVTLNNKWSRWRNQQNGLTHGSVLVPIVFNIYTKDQPITEETKHFLYADDSAIAVHNIPRSRT